MQSVPNDLKPDYSQLLNLAGSKGFVTRDEVLKGPAQWSASRLDAALSEMLSLGLAMVDDGDPSCVRRYYFPVLQDTS